MDGTLDEPRAGELAVKNSVVTSPTSPGASTSKTASTYSVKETSRLRSEFSEMLSICTSRSSPSTLRM